jgi:apolipoprotein N-acyltransferase
MTTGQDDAPTVRAMNVPVRPAVTATVVCAILLGLAGLVYAFWEVIWNVPFALDWIIKAVVTGKVLKAAVIAAIAIIAAATAVTRWIRRGSGSGTDPEAAAPPPHGAAPPD